MAVMLFNCSGDILSIDTASITGEPLPRNYPSDDYGSLILCGTTVKAGEVLTRDLSHLNLLHRDLNVTTSNMVGVLCGEKDRNQHRSWRLNGRNNGGQNED